MDDRMSSQGKTWLKLETLLKTLGNAGGLSPVS